MSAEASSTRHVPRRSSSSRSLLRWLARSRALRRVLPGSLRRWARRCFLPTAGYHWAAWSAADAREPIEDVSTYPAQVDVRLGILREFTGRHRFFVAACQELGVAYQLIDISGPDWMDVVRRADCPAFLAFPLLATSDWRLFYDERLRIMVDDLGLLIQPSYEELAIYESKRRMTYWLQAHHFAHPRTWIYYDYDAALDFAKKADLPIVGKTNVGWGGQGVHIFRKRRDLIRHVHKCFTTGQTIRIHFVNREWGHVFLQEYILDAREWRMIRIGDSYFGYEKVKVGDFHSGSHFWNYHRPPDDALNLLKDLTDAGGFTSMNADILVDRNGQLLVNELQALPGHPPIEMCVVEGQPGRMIHDQGQWTFQPGNFCQNHLCNLRVGTVLKQLGIALPTA